MGLDMYLYKKIYIGAKYELNNVKGTISLTQNGKPIDINLNKVVYIIEDQAYWRKANAIHYWFVREVQRGEDNCASYYVSYEKLQELVKVCKKVLANKKLAEKYLPTHEGFFFGGCEYDDYYFETLKSTINQLSNLDKNADYEYHSSW